MKYNERGEELPDSTPVEVTLNFKRPKSINEMIAEAVRVQFSRVAQSQGFETFDEADDFDVGDEDEPISASEMTEDQEFYKGDKDVGRKDSGVKPVEDSSGVSGAGSVGTAGKAVSGAGPASVGSDSGAPKGAA